MLVLSSPSLSRLFRKQHEPLDLKSLFGLMRTF